MIKIADVAKKANVSTATVSRVISNSCNVSTKTKEKVLEVIEELKYQPNVLARQLRRRETKTVLVIVPDISNMFFSDVLRGIESIARQTGYFVLLGDTQNNIELESDYFNIIRQRQADGMILLTARIGRSEVEEMCKEYPVVIACEYIEGANIPTVSIDNVSSARKAVEHLIGLGHKRIAFMSGPMNVVLSRDRLRGYCQAMMRHELPADSMLIQEGDYSLDSGYHLMKKYLSFQCPPTALFTANDEMAIGAMKALKEAGLRIPEDMAIVGFDNIKYSEIVEPSLTTISQPTFDIGEKAMKMLLRLIRGEKLSKKNYVLEDRLVIRQSCGYAATKAKNKV